MEQAARKFGRVSKAASYATMADLARRSFNDAFWFGAGGYLYDVIDGERRDASLRPNQILTISLSFSMLDSARAQAVVEAVERELLTPRGLRSLAPSDPRYRGRYVGDAATRDKGYLLFSSPDLNTIFRWSPAGIVDIYRPKSGYTGTNIGEYHQLGSNGLTFDRSASTAIAA